MKKRFLALFIVIVMLFSNISVLATGIEQEQEQDLSLAGTIVDDFESVYSNDGLSELIVLEEITELREANVKHFSLSNGLNKAVAYSQPVHYMDESGNWMDIDNSLSLQGNEYSTNNKFEIKFANKSGSSGLLSIKDGDYKIDFTPLNTNKVNVVIENPQENNSRKFDDVKALRNLISKATYSNIYNGIDIEYILTGNNIKENIIVNSQQESYVYSFELKLNKLTAELSNGSIILSDSTTGENMYVIPAPYMYDANGVMSTDVEYSLVQNNKWKYTFTVTANNEWINADDRAFPVTIDPTIIADNVDNDTFIMLEDYDYTTSNSLIVGNFFGMFKDVPGFMKFNTLPDIQPGTYLVQAKVTMHISYLENTNDVDFYLGVFRAQKDWVTSGFADVFQAIRTYESNSTTANYNNYVNTLQSYFASTPENSVQVLSDGPYEWDITSLYKDWKNGTANNGICVKAVGLPENENANVRISTIESATNNYIPPQIELTYAEPKGIDDDFALENTTLGTVGNSYVNLFNGNLTYINNLTTIENQVLPYEINMVYNSTDGAWTTSFDEKITLFEDSNDIMGNNIVRYLWHDADGTTHYFTPYLQKNWWGDYVQYEESPVGDLWATNDPVVFYPEDDIDYVLTKTTTGEFVLKDYVGNQRLFNSNGQLSKICDAQGNVLYFYYICDDNTSIVDGILPELFLIVYKPANSEAIQQVKLWYDQGKLCYIHNLQTNQEVIIEWNNELISTISYTDEEQNSNNYVDFFYSNDDDLSSIVNVINSNTSNLQYLIDYSYDDNKVDEICQYSNSQLESKFTISYNSTVEVRDFGESMEETIDDMLTTYSFDDKGRKTRKVKTNYISGALAEDLLFSYNDSVLPSNVYYYVEFSDNINLEPFTTITDAAVMFFDEIYATSFYIKHEFGTRIYSRTSNTITTYNFTHVATGTAHGTNYTKATIPNDTTFVATAHTHPNSNTFSSKDINNTIARNTDSYMVGPNLLLNLYDVSERESYYSVLPIATSITLNEGNILVDKFRESWLNHISNGCENGFDCDENTLWPNTQMIE